MKLDRQMLGLLSLLAQNCRFSHVALGKALRLSKDAVRYRIAELERSGYLPQYILFVDARKLGFYRYHLLLRLDASLKKKAELFSKLSSHPAVMWVNSFVGRFDLQIIIDARSNFEVQDYREALFGLLKEKVLESIVLGHLYDLEFTQLNPTLRLPLSIEESNDASFHPEATSKRFPVTSEFQEVSVDKIDVDILKALADNPRSSLSDISIEAGIERITARRRIKRLIEKKVILNFGGIPNLELLGYITYYFLVRLLPRVPEEDLRSAFEKFSNIFYAGRMVGDYDLILYLNARSPQELNESIQLFRATMDKFIVSTELLIQDKVYHWRQFTPAIESGLRTEKRRSL